MNRVALMATFIIVFFITLSCAGPSTPFGSNLNFTKKRVDLIQVSPSSNTRISSHPKTKLYHKPYDLTFTIKNSEGLREPFEYNLLYNGVIVDRWIKTESIKFNKDKTEAKIMFKKIKLRANQNNKITLLYYDKKHHAPLYYELDNPTCSLSRYKKINSIGDFKNKAYLKEEINKLGKLKLINPVLMASLVAQESSFNPKAISIARAIGLTQVTPIANQDIRNIDPSLKSYPKVHQYSYPELKYKIYTGEMNKENDWRLDEYKSLKGGAIYLKWLSDYWSKDKNSEFLTRHLSKVNKTEIILASYNSGATRVRKNIISLKDKWLESKDLGEAKKYVYNIKSYCHDFRGER